MLDYFGRELEVWSAAKNFPRLRESAAALRNTWVAVRPRVVARGGVAESAKFDVLVKRVGAATTLDAFALCATPLLNEVDVLEAVFRR